MSIIRETEDKTYIHYKEFYDQQMLHPLLADTQNFPQIGRFQLPTNTETKIRIILFLNNINFRVLRKLLRALSL